MSSRFGPGFCQPPDGTAWLGPAAFGFGGLGGSLGFADPDTGIAFGYVMNRMRQAFTSDPRAADLAAARSAPAVSRPEVSPATRRAWWPGRTGEAAGAPRSPASPPR